MPHSPAAAIPTAFQRQALDRCLVIDQSHHNLTVLRSGLAVNHHQVAGQDACVQHGLAPDPQGKILPGPTGGIEGQIVLDTLLRQNGAAGRHIAHHWDLIFRLRRFPQRDGAALAGALFNDACLLKPFEVKMDCGG